jgi:peptidylprolyl isomerase
MTEMPFEKDDFILIDYVAKVKETGEVFDTTIEGVARKEKLYKEDEIYEPKLVTVGEGWVLKPLDESLSNLELNKATPIEIPPEKAFGNRDPEKVRLMPLRRLTTKGITPQLGMRVEIDGKLAVIRTMGAGRVQLDFNPPLAGKTIIYEVTVQKKIETKREKINALIHRRIPVVDITKFNSKIGKTSIEINVPEEAFYVEGLQLAKRGIATDIQKFFPELATIKFVEMFKKKEPTAAAPVSKPTEPVKPTEQTEKSEKTEQK